MLKETINKISIFLVATYLMGLGLAACDHKEEHCIDGLKSGVILSFDDFSSSWQEHLHIFKHYDARAIFYVSGKFLSNEEETVKHLGEIWQQEQSIGVHTLSHSRVPELYSEDPEGWTIEEIEIPRMTLEKVFGQAPMAFAYPHGDHNHETDEVLGKIFHHLRGFGDSIQFYSVGEINEGGFYKATSIDNIKKRSKEYLKENLEVVSRTRCSVWPVATHHIGSQDWGISIENLEWFLSEVKRLKLIFYVPEDFKPKAL